MGSSRRQCRWRRRQPLVKAIGIKADPTSVRWFVTDQVPESFGIVKLFSRQQGCGVQYSGRFRGGTPIVGTARITEQFRTIGIAPFGFLYYHKSRWKSPSRHTEVECVQYLCRLPQIFGTEQMCRSSTIQQTVHIGKGHDTPHFGQSWQEQIGQLSCNGFVIIVRIFLTECRCHAHVLQQADQFLLCLRVGGGRVAGGIGFGFGNFGSRVVPFESGNAFANGFGKFGGFLDESFRVLRRYSLFGQLLCPLVFELRLSQNSIDAYFGTSGPNLVGAGLSSESLLLR